MSLREWLIAIGTLVIIGIVIDGLRRMRRARKESIAISSGMGANDLKESPLDEEHNSELPNGGARAISKDTLEERGYVRREKPSRSRVQQQKPTRPARDLLRKDAKSPDDSRPLAVEPAAEIGIQESAEDSVKRSEDSAEYRDDIAEDHDDFDEEAGFSSVDQENPTADIGWGADDGELLSAPEPEDVDPNLPLAGANRPEAREVIVINVLSRQGEDFSGSALQKLFEACGLVHGDMKIYHRHEAEDTISPVQFSVANAVEPGTFKPNDVAAMTTPGISFFMSMPGPTSSMQAFDFMLETAQCVVRNLGGELKDERRSVMTAQTIEHCRQRIREYERKQRTPRR
ncbi:cell division protein ZipA [Marinobacter antarcticus]|uniref:Cell division protein ZipA n=2 Tax=root TaxID=1 RepID=A0A831R185_9GAMM|nr:cell division protein ZipA [Marinobacter antarcticus]HEA52136.1 cell division protein ZipA [Marinobacter antarcticus]